MKTSTRNILFGLSLLAAGVAIGWGVANRRAHETGASAPTTAPTERKVLYWYDPMSPTQKFDKPGKSPYMDMQLVPRYADEEVGATGGVAVSPQAIQSLGVRLALVEKISMGENIDAVGTLQLSERDVSIVQARAAGFVEKTYARAPGDVIAAGAPLVDLLLPDWVAAQREFLAVKATGDDTLTAATRQRLALLGMPASVIAQVERSAQPQGTYTVVAPTAGLIAELMVRPGMTVTPGMALARINGLGTVWLDLAVPEAQAGTVRAGQQVEARFVAYAGETFRGKIAAVLPESSRETRTLRVRVELPNPGQRLKAGMFAQVALKGPQAEALAVPSDAVIRTGRRAIAYVVDAPGRYRPVEVELGPEVGGKLIVRSGLQAGQQVVASSQFLVDSEASLRGVLAPRSATPASASGAAAAASSVATAAAPSATPVAGAGTGAGAGAGAAGAGAGAGGARAGAAAAIPAVYSATGKVVEVTSDSVMLSHSAIPELKWPPMTMGFKLTDAKARQSLKPQQSVAFTFRKEGDDYLITSIKPAAAAGTPTGTRRP